MSALAVVLIVLGVLVLLLFVGGYIANARRREAERAALLARAREADRHLADAHAQDKGWEPAGLERSARNLFAEQRPGAEIGEQALVQVIDRPGTDEDKAVFRFVTSEGTVYLTLGRRGGEWFAERVD